MGCARVFTEVFREGDGELEIIRNPPGMFTVYISL